MVLCNSSESLQARATLKPEDYSSSGINILSFEDIITATREDVNPLSLYDIATITGIRNNADTILRHTDLSEYSALQQRFAQGPLTQIEIAEFVRANLYNPSTLLDDLRDNAPSVSPSNTAILLAPYTPVDSVNTFLSALNIFYGNNATSVFTANFCALFSIALDQTIGIVSSLAEKLSDLKNFDLSLGINTLLRPLTELKDRIFNMIDNLAKTLKAQVDNIVKDLTNKFNDIKMSIGRLARVINRKVIEIKDFFNDLNLQNIKDTAEKFISRLAGQFSKIDLKTLQFILYKACQAISSIESFMSSPVEGLKSFISNAISDKIVIENRSNSATRDAVTSGFQRISAEEAKAARQQIADSNRERNNYSPNLTPIVSNYTTIIQPTVEETAAVAIIKSTNYYERSGPYREQLAGGSFELGSQVVFMHSNVLDAYPGAGYKQVKDDLWVLLLRLSKAAGSRLVINSAYRSPEYNRRIGGAKASIHMGGGAMDIQWPSSRIQDRQMFIKHAIETGAKGIGIYNNFCHIDIGDKRAWGPNGSRTSLSSYPWALDVLKQAGY